ncbi:hypothetical protein BRADI_3g14888v3 [Brachypodium distachyon]|uniref:Ubiquitin-like protease family profile domain-containing protein n=1 Tax=Brachypodium distachyon TaxID=15368 RepID=A0A0Q3JA23_BRADI|nr:hypothetical protein BRADI_3g14888v3 [Brachypodium distachyon]
MQHWFLFIVDLRDEKFIVLDSLFGPDNILHRESSQLLIKNFIKAWYDRGLPRLRFEDYGIMFPRVPKQNDGMTAGSS